MKVLRCIVLILLLTQSFLYIQTVNAATGLTNENILVENTFSVAPNTFLNIFSGTVKLPGLKLIITSDIPVEACIQTPGQYSASAQQGFGVIFATEMFPGTGFGQGSTSIAETFQIANLGQWYVTILNRGSQSANVLVKLSEGFPVTVEETSVTCETDKIYYNFGESIQVSGTITPIIQTAEISLVILKPDKTKITQKVSTNSDGKYQYTLVPNLKGAWEVSATFSGNSKYGYSESKKIVVYYDMVKTSITCETDKKEYYLEEAVKISGIINPVIQNPVVKLVIKDPTNKITDVNIDNIINGHYEKTMNFNKYGDWTITAKYIGDNLTIPSEVTTTIKITKITPKISIEINSNTFNYNDEVVIKGKIDPYVNGLVANIEIYNRDTHQSKFLRLTVLEDGSYEYKTTHISAGRYMANIKTEQTENIFFGYSTGVDINIQKSTMEITLNIKQTKVSDGVRVSIYGAVKPIENSTEPIKVKLNLIKPNGSKDYTFAVISNSKYNYTLTFTEKGVWKVQATMDATTNHDAGVSTSETFTLLGSGSTIKILLKDKDGLKLETAKVSSTLTPTGQDPFVVQTNKEGVVEIPNIKEGNYNIKIEKTGYVSKETSLILIESQSTTLDYVIEKEQISIPAYSIEIFLIGLIFAIIVLTHIRNLNKNNIFSRARDYS